MIYSASQPGAELLMGLPLAVSQDGPKRVLELVWKLAAAFHVGFFTIL